MATQDRDIIFINRPIAKEHNVPYKAPPPPANPVIRGAALHYLAQVVASLGFVQSILWANAGFAALRDRPELVDIDPRYEPTVIKSTGRKATGDERYLSTVSTEDWRSKQPPKRTFYSSLDYHEAYKSGRLTPLQVAEALMPLIRRDVKEPTSHSVAFLDTKVELVRKAAAASSARWKAGKPLSPLDGVPMAVKDEADLTGYKKCSGSRLDFTNKDDATSYCVQLWLDAGAICLGKTTMHELGMDTTNINPNFGTPVNPYSSNYYCGGSSGGSAYAVAAGLLPFTMGHDGGGSVRVPSAYCGLFGLKTSHGRVSYRPSSNLAKSTGVPGPLAANMVDLELAYRVMSQPDADDSDSSLFAAPTFVNTTDHSSKKLLGIYKTWFDRADEPVKTACQKTLDYLTSKLGYEIIDVSIPLIHDGQLAHAMTILAEVASGVPSVSQLTAPNKVLICCGKITSGVDMLQAAKVRSLLMQHLSHLYSQHPGLIIVTPTTPNAGWAIHPGDLKYGCSNGNMQIRNMEYAWLANFSGCPSISAPVAYLEPEKGMEGKVPVSLMGMSEWGSEDELIAFGYDVERWVHEGLEGGRVRSGNWVDVIGLAEEGGNDM